jgi:3-oxoacyl-[acyl-carrier protein] reductase
MNEQRPSSGAPVLLVAGGTRGIGAAVVARARASGARVAYCGRSVPESGDVDASMSERRDLLALRADVAREDDVDRVFERTLAAFGRIDAVVNRPGLLVSFPDRHWQELFAVNLTAGFLLARRAVRGFLEQGRPGHIVFMGSLMQEGSPAGACYATSKGAQLGLARGIARAYGPFGITANVVVCGYVPTELTRELTEPMKRALVEACPQRRAATAEEVAAVVTFLTLGDGTRLNGQVIRVAGGLTEVPTPTSAPRREDHARAS